MSFSTCLVSPDAIRLISGILDEVTIGLQLNQTQKGRAKQSYNGVTDWLAADGSDIGPYNPWLFPHGSLAQDTTVHPISRSEFDLDIICRVDYARARRPEDVYKAIWDRMHANGTYRPLMEDMPRCIRLNYAKESRFHLDIVPAIPDLGRGGTYILIPDGSGDGDGMVWKTSNPIGFKGWLEKKKVVVAFKEARARVDPLNEPLPAEQKATLTKSIQLLKRWRDVRWENEPKLATPSIVLTYLAASLYQGEGSLAYAFENILDGLTQFVDSGVRKIYSPVNDQEVISEKWLSKPEVHESFVEGVRHLRRRWDELLEIGADSTLGIPSLSATMQGIFGEPVIGGVKSALGIYTQARATGNLHLDKKSASLLLQAPVVSVMPSAARVKPNTHFGN